MLLDLQSTDVEQRELDLDDPGADRTQLMEALDTLNDRYRRGQATFLDETRTQDPGIHDALGRHASSACVSAICQSEFQLDLRVVRPDQLVQAGL